MRILFLEAYKQSPISVKIALPFAYLTLASYVTSRSDKYKFFFHSYQLDHLCGGEAVSIPDLMYRYDPKVTADTYISLGSTAKDSNDLTLAKIFYNKALSYYKLANYDTGVGWALGNLGHIARLSKEYNEAKELYGEALDRLSRVNRLDRIAVVREGLALMERECSNIPAAYVNACTAEELYRQLGMFGKARKIKKLQHEIKEISESKAGEG